MWTKCIIKVCVHPCSTTRRLHTVCLYDRQIRDQMMADHRNADLRVKVIIPPPTPRNKGGGQSKTLLLVSNADWF